jgi:hemoglobin
MVVADIANHTGVTFWCHAAPQVQFLSAALGGPEPWRGPDMRTAHMRLIRTKGLGPEHFDVVAELLVASLQQLGVSKPVVDEVVGVVAPLRAMFEREPQQQQQPAPAAAPAVENNSLFSRLGGTGAISAAVDVFYSKVLVDPRIKHFFEGVDMKAQTTKQVSTAAGLLCSGLVATANRSLALTLPL